MTNFIVFGKPRAFESYEYVFGRDNFFVENVHREPILKPIEYDDSILHYFVREGFAGLEYYTRAKGYESERDGIVFGVAIKSTTDFNITDTILNVLVRFWTEFASQLLDGGRKFENPSIIGLLKNTQWSQAEVDLIQSTSLFSSIKNAQKKILLLVSPQIDDIRLVEDSIKEYTDVYVADSSGIFKDRINEIVLKEADNQIFQIIDGTIVPLVETEPLPPVTSTSIFRNIVNSPIWGRKPQPEGENPEKPDKPSNTFNKKWWIAVAVCLVVVLFAVVKYLPDEQENKTNKGQVTPDTAMVRDNNPKGTPVLGKTSDSIDCDATSVQLASYNSPIKKSLSLNPIILPETSSNIKDDLSFAISNTLLVHIDRETYELIVDKRPDEDTEVTVKVYIGNVFLGQQKYTIAKAEPIRSTGTTGTQQSQDSKLSSATTARTNSDKHIPYYKGKPVKKDEYIRNLRVALNNGTMTPAKVKEECQKIINGDYGDFGLDPQAIALRKEAEQKISDNNEAKPGF